MPYGGGHNVNPPYGPPQTCPPLLILWLCSDHSLAYNHSVYTIERRGATKLMKWLPDMFHPSLPPPTACLPASLSLPPTTLAKAKIGNSFEQAKKKKKAMNRLKAMSPSHQSSLAFLYILKQWISIPKSSHRFPPPFHPPLPHSQFLYPPPCFRIQPLYLHSLSTSSDAEPCTSLGCLTVSVAIVVCLCASQGCVRVFFSMDPVLSRGTFVVSLGAALILLLGGLCPCGLDESSISFLMAPLIAITSAGFVSLSAPLRSWSLSFTSLEPSICILSKFGTRWCMLRLPNQVHTSS